MIFNGNENLYYYYISLYIDFESKMKSIFESEFNNYSTVTKNSLINTYGIYSSDRKFKDGIVSLNIIKIKVDNDYAKKTANMPLRLVADILRKMSEPKSVINIEISEISLGNKKIYNLKEGLLFFDVLSKLVKTRNNLAHEVNSMATNKLLIKALSTEVLEGTLSQYSIINNMTEEPFIDIVKNNFVFLYGINSYLDEYIDGKTSSCLKKAN